MKWISVEERLPEARFVVLAWYGHPDDGFITMNLLNDQGVWVDGAGEYQVTHWMPLPEPPEEG